jgi:hypothetical protein
MKLINITEFASSSFYWTITKKLNKRAKSRVEANRSKKEQGMGKKRALGLAGLNLDILSFLSLGI